MRKGASSRGQWKLVSGGLNSVCQLRTHKQLSSETRAQQTVVFLSRVAVISPCEGLLPLKETLERKGKCGGS